MYEILPGKTVPARVYSMRYNNALLKMTVADGRDQDLPGDPVVDHAISQLTQGGELKVNYPHRIYRIYGRQFSFARPDGGFTSAAAFFANERLYLIEATGFHGANTSDLIQFAQSLTFDRNVANRSPETIRAIREACRSLVNPAFGAGLDDPRCVQR